MMKRSLSVAAAVLVVLGGCGGTETGPPSGATGAATDAVAPREPSVPQAPDGNFVLYVSNQSFDLPRVDIRIEIDGRVAVDEKFDVEGQHNWLEFRFDLPRGRHTLKAVSTVGDAERSWSFNVKGKHWAVVDYWYYPGDPKHFSFDISDEPIGFA
jgi:hypothetical protein